MKYDPDRHHRQSIRLRGYDYTQAGAYFVTIVVRDRECLLGDIVDEEMRLNDYGRVVAAEWQKIPARFPHMTADASIVMPNHLHGIIVIGDGVGAKHPLTIPNAPLHLSADASPLRPMGTTPGSLGAIVQNFKSTSTRQVNALRHTPGLPLWQRNYFERIVRDGHELNRIREYIINNPLKWALDAENPGIARRR
jgi:REP element-mobilizing transposase RayT